MAATTATTEAGPGPARLHALCLAVADRAQDVAWQAYVQDRRPHSGVAASLGVLDAYLRLGEAVGELLDALADVGDVGDVAERGQLTARGRDARSVTVTVNGGHPQVTLRVQAHRQPSRTLRQVRIIMDSTDSTDPTAGRPRKAIHQQQKGEACDEQS